MSSGQVAEALLNYAELPVQVWAAAVANQN